MSAAPQQATPQQQGTHFFVLSLEKPGRFSMTQEGTCTPPPGATRADMYQRLYQAVTAADPNLSDATVAFFSLERNQL